MSLDTFTSEGIGNWARQNLVSASVVHSAGMACFRSVITADCEHEAMVTGGKHPKDLPEFHWINTVLSNLMTSLSGTLHAFKLEKYSNRYPGEFYFRFNRRFNLAQMTKPFFESFLLLWFADGASLEVGGSSCVNQVRL